LALLPVDVFIEDLNDAFEVKRQHEDTQWIVLHGKAVTQQKLVIVELPV
jgi:hypothetical protein